MARVDELLSLAHQRASDLKLTYAGALSPREAHELLGLAPQSRLIDVRTKAEWDWVGRVPGAIEIEWQAYPGAVPNGGFLDSLKASATANAPLLFLCRSGARSAAAASAATSAGFAHCYNVLEGFEGDKDGNGQRNRVNGWRFAGLPWQQS